VFSSPQRKVVIMCVCVCVHEDVCLFFCFWLWGVWVGGDDLG
jgi:hypothetical protein